MHFTFRKTLSGLLILMLLLASGCGASKSGESGADSSFTIVTSFYPMYVLTLNITENVPDVQVVNMAEPQTGCLHDYQMTTADMKKLDGADVLVVNGAGMERFLDNMDEIVPGLKVITATEGLELLEDEHEMNAEEDDFNPHIWVSPKGAAGEVLNIAQGLAETDPAHAELYLANGQAYAERLYALSDEMKAQFDTLTDRTLVTFHEAFPYFANEFGLKIAAVVESEPGEEPSAKELDSLIQLIKKEKIPAIFVEDQYADTTAEIIADESGAKIYKLDLVVTGDADFPEDETRTVYENAMRENTRTIMEALQ